MAERGAPIDDVAHHAADRRRAARRARAGRRRAPDRSPATPSPRCSRRPRRRSRPGATRRPIRHASRALDLHQADPSTERSLLLVRLGGRARAAQRSPRRSADAERGARPAPSPTATAIAGGRGPPPARARSPRCRATCRRPARELDAAVELFRDARRRPAGSPTRCGPGASPRCSAARSTTPGRSSARRWRSTTRSTTSAGHAWTHQNLAWVAFQAGDFDDAEVAAARGQGALRGARRRQRRQLGRRAAGLRVCTSSAASTRPSSWPSPSRARPGGGPTAGPG